VQHVVEPLRVGDALLERAVGVFVPEAVWSFGADVDAGGTHAGRVHVSVGPKGVPAAKAHIRGNLILLTDVGSSSLSCVVDDFPLVLSFCHDDDLPCGYGPHGVFESLSSIAEILGDSRVPHIDPNHPLHAVRSVALCPEEDTVGDAVREKILDEKISL